MSSKSMLYLATLVVLVLGMSLTGCSKKKPETAPQVTSTEGAGAAEPLETEDTGIMEGRTSGPMVPVYFEFDSSRLEKTQFCMGTHVCRYGFIAYLLCIYLHGW